MKFYHIEELQEAIKGADFIIGGVSSFGVEWFGNEVLPQLEEGVPVISVTKRLMNTEDGTLLTYLDLWQAKFVGILLGRGLTITEAKEELAGVTLESLVVAERVAKAVRVKAEKGLVDASEFPLLLHIDEIITQGKPVDIPWEKFTFEK